MVMKTEEVRYRARQTQRLQLIRHGKPAYEYPGLFMFMDSSSFNECLDKYEKSSLDEQRLRIRPPVYEQLVSSDLLRAVETAHWLADKRKFSKSPLFREVPLPRINSKLFFAPVWITIVLLRLLWRFDLIGVPETVTQTNQRVQKAADEIDRRLVRTSNLAIISHDFFLRLLRHELIKRGWQTNSKAGIMAFLQSIEFTRRF
jgi:broad specificity phosphatase PhoE